MNKCSFQLRAKVLVRFIYLDLNIFIYKSKRQSLSVCSGPFCALNFKYTQTFSSELMSGSSWCMQNDPQDPFVTHNACIVRFLILSQTLVLGDPVCTKQVPGQYQELVLIMWTAFIPWLTNSSRGSFAHLLHWRRCKRYISIFFS